MLEIKINSADLMALATAFPKQVQRAAELALDNTAVAIKKAEQIEMKRVFDRPTPFTINSLQVTKTQRHELVATVWFKRGWGGSGFLKHHYLEPQVFGGTRPQKRFEKELGGEFYIPGKGARRNAYGNMPYGQVVQILSVLGKAEYVSGYMANITARSRKRNKKARDYFQMHKQHGSRRPGVYLRTGQSIRPVLIQVKSVSYRKRFPFFEVANQVAKSTMMPQFKRYFTIKLIGGQR